jgi:hypothetical protein
MRRNLISLGTLEAMGYKYTVDNGVIKVTQGNRVILKGNCINNLYYLQGSTITGTLVIASSPASISIASNTSNTKLWHMRLGHMSEKVCISCTRDVIWRVLINWIFVNIVSSVNKRGLVSLYLLTALNAVLIIFILIFGVGLLILQLEVVII